MTSKVAAVAFLSRTTNELTILNSHVLGPFCDTNSNLFRTGLYIHCPIIKLGLVENHDLWNNLLSVYLKTDGIWNARKFFDEMPNITIFAWTIMIYAYTKSQDIASALLLFEEMVASGAHPNEFTFSSVIRSCAGLRDLNYGARVQGSVIKTRFDGNSIIGSILTDLYSKCGKLKEALELFASLENADTISWKMMLSSLVEAHKWREGVAVSLR